MDETFTIADLNDSLPGPWILTHGTAGYQVQWCSESWADHTNLSTWYETDWFTDADGAVAAAIAGLAV